jgi:hypothetical protein
MSSTGEDIFDPASIAEDAIEEGIIYYEGVSLMKYNNLAAWITILYQFWEQQVRLFLYEEEKHYFEIDFKSFCTGNIITQIEKEFMDHGVDITRLSSWPGITELRLLCNTIKHGDGKSAEDLKKIRPDIFRGIDIFTGNQLDLFKTTLNEEVLNLTTDMLLQYGTFLIEFWDGLPERMIYIFR